MYCPHCGATINKNNRFCSQCGSSRGEARPETLPSANLRGFSSRIGDPAFTAYVQNSNRWSAIFAVILAVAAVVGFYIAGEVGTEMDNPGSLAIGFVIGGMFLTIAFFQILGRKRSKTWDGTVVDKRIREKTERDQHSETRYLQYQVIIQSDEGRKHILRSRNNDTLYNYYQIGDRVRHHAGLRSFEKYDKSGDKFIPCNACATLNKIKDDYCSRCKCPLLK